MHIGDGVAWEKGEQWLAGRTGWMMQLIAHLPETCSQTYCWYPNVQSLPYC